jgi:hypothetical protein
MTYITTAIYYTKSLAVLIWSLISIKMWQNTIKGNILIEQARLKHMRNSGNVSGRIWKGSLNEAHFMTDFSLALPPTCCVMLKGIWTECETDKLTVDRNLLNCITMGEFLMLNLLSLLLLYMCIGTVLQLHYHNTRTFCSQRHIIEEDLRESLKDMRCRGYRYFIELPWLMSESVFLIIHLIDSWDMMHADYSI